MFDRDKFKLFVDTMIDEYNAKDGVVEIEFATGVQYLSQKRAILNEALNRIRPFSYSVYWNIYPCETCKGYRPDKPYHVILETIPEKWGDSGKDS